MVAPEADKVSTQIELDGVEKTDGNCKKDSSYINVYILALMSIQPPPPLTPYILVKSTDLHWHNQKFQSRGGGCKKVLHVESRLSPRKEWGLYPGR